MLCLSRNLWPEVSREVCGRGWYVVGVGAVFDVVGFLGVVEEFRAQALQPIPRLRSRAAV